MQRAACDVAASRRCHVVLVYTYDGRADTRYCWPTEVLVFVNVVRDNVSFLRAHKVLSGVEMLETKGEGLVELTRCHTALCHENQLTLEVEQCKDCS